MKLCSSFFFFFTASQYNILSSNKNGKFSWEKKTKASRTNLSSIIIGKQLGNRVNTSAEISDLNLELFLANLKFTRMFLNPSSTVVHRRENQSFFCNSHSFSDAYLRLK